MAPRRRSFGHQHRPDWEQRLCRVDAALADGDLSPAQAREWYRAIALSRAEDRQPGEHPDQLRLDIGPGPGPDAGEPPPLP